MASMDLANRLLLDGGGVPEETLIERRQSMLKTAPQQTGSGNAHPRPEDAFFTTA